MTILGVIPARFGSTRFPGKPLALISGRPLLQWVLEGAAKSRKINQLLVATDHPDIAKLTEKLGFEAVMTDSDLPSGSDRIWAAVQSKSADIIVNIQGDEPLIQAAMLDALVEPLESDPELEMSTLGREIKMGDLESQQTAKIALNQAGEALYFSRFPIPYSRATAEEQPQACCKHIGVYAYRKSFLEKFCQCPPVALEMAESLEQLRALYLGARIKVVKTNYDSWGVDTPEDVKKIESMISAQGRSH